MPKPLGYARRRLVLTALLLGASAGATGCLEKDLNNPRPSRMEVRGGDGQSVAPLARTANPLVIQLFDQYGNVMPGRTITWRVESGGGSVSDASTTTDDAGLARTFYTAGSTAGRADVSATLAGLGTLIFTLTVATPPGS